jgi:DNA-binding transcriptional LysR family regulator
MDLLGALGVLVRVVETGSFSAAARERELSQAAVARQIAQLEDHFGVRLFHRTTRKLSLTDDGQMLLGLARPVLDGVEGMEAAPRAAKRLASRPGARGCHGDGQPLPFAPSAVSAH